MQMIRKAVFPVAGLGTRFLPATKANPKEMLAIVDKPLIQYAVEEAIAAGITELIFVTSSAKRAIEDHFDRNIELETLLQSRDEQNLLSIVKNILPEGVNCAYIRQQQALGLGHAILCAQSIVGNEPFAVLLADDLIQSKPPCLLQMLEMYKEKRATVLAVEEIPLSLSNRYGVIDLIEETSSRLKQIRSIVEKPLPQEAPSNLAAVGRYILTPAIFEALRLHPQGRGGEWQLTDGIAELIKHESVFAYAFQGKRYDCGSKLGYLQASFDYACEHPDVGEAFKIWLKSKMVEISPHI